MAFNMVKRSFTATSLRSFWRYWNPGFNYYLYYYCYCPLRGFLSRDFSLLITFAFCGFAHDVLFLVPVALAGGRGVPFPFVTSWFTLIALSISITDRLRISLGCVPSFVRGLVHGLFLALTFACIVLLQRRL